MSKSKRFNRTDNNLLLAIIGDEETVTGFLLSGIGERNENTRNYFVINKEEKNEVEDIFRSLVNRKDIGIILISQHIADVIREDLDTYNEIIPTVLEIPSKNFPYSVEKDSIMQKAYKQLYGQNAPVDEK
jgi:V-type H+-transporting ATPase subunit F